MFKFNSVSSKEMKVSAIEENFKERASQRYEEIIIDGKDSSTYDIFGYSMVSSSLELILHDLSKEEDIYKWLKGKGIFEYEDKVSIAYFMDSIIMEDLFSKKKRIKTTFMREPFWYKKEDDFLLVNNKVTNEGNEISFPIIKLVGTGSVDITINNTRFIYNFDEDGEVEIDCKEKTETYEGISKSKNIEIGFEYPYLTIGENDITVHSGSVDIYIKRKDVWL